MYKSISFEDFILLILKLSISSSYQQVFPCLAPNDLRYEKEAEKRATIYRPKTPPKRERKLQFCWCSAFFYDRLLGAGIR